MDLSLINSQIASAVSRAGAVAGAASGAAPGAGVGKAAGLDFASALDSALKSVSDSQAGAEQMQREFQADSPTVSLEQAMVELNKSQLGFSAAVQVRNRLVQAYDSVMNMPV